MSTAIKDLYAAVTAEAVRQIENGVGTWRMPWQAIADEAQPVNASTHQPYRGGNHLILGMTAVANSWAGNWATYKQWKTLGAQVRKGEHGTHAVKWSEVEDRKTGEKRMIPFAFTVFAGEQVDGWEPPARITRDTTERIEAASQFFDRIGADVHHGGNRAFYSSAGDFIQLPNLDQFPNIIDYYATAAHEHAHWTGHTTRLDRNLETRFGTDAYAAEELVAEMASAFTCAHLHISPTPRPDHAQYLATWLKVLKADTTAIFHAASKAQAAADHLTTCATREPAHA